MLQELSVRPPKIGKRFNGNRRLLLILGKSHKYNALIYKVLGNFVQNANIGIKI